jgi:hypothetical protein
MHKQVQIPRHSASLRVARRSRIQLFALDASVNLATAAGLHAAIVVREAA